MLHLPGTLHHTCTSPQPPLDSRSLRGPQPLSKQSQQQPTISSCNDTQAKAVTTPDSPNALSGNLDTPSGRNAHPSTKNTSSVVPTNYSKIIDQLAKRALEAEGQISKH